MTFHTHTMTCHCELTKRLKEFCCENPNWYHTARDIKKLHTANYEFAKHVYQATYRSFFASLYIC